MRKKLKKTPQEVANDGSSISSGESGNEKSSSSTEHVNLTYDIFTPNLGYHAPFSLLEYKCKSGYDLIDNKKYDEAIRCFNEILNLDENFDNAQLYLGYAKYMKYKNHGSSNESLRLEAFKHMEKIAKNGKQIHADYFYGRALMDYCISKSLDRTSETFLLAKEHIEKSIKNNYPKALDYTLSRGDYFYNNNKFELAIKAYTLLADQDYIPALLKLGKLYQEGKGEIPQNKLKALEFYRKASDLGSFEATSILQSLDPETATDFSDKLFDLPEADSGFQLA